MRRSPPRRRCEISPLVAVVPEQALGSPLHPVAHGERRGPGTTSPSGSPARHDLRPAADVLTTAFRLGLTSFGGPVAHVGYFHDEYVDRRRWIRDEEFSELVAVTNLLPGPMSSQLGIAIGAHHAGVPGAAAAWVGFTLPSAVAMTALALVVGGTDVAGAGWVHGLELVAVPVVLLALLAMRRSLAPDASAPGAGGVAAFCSRSGSVASPARRPRIAFGAIVGVVLFGALARRYPA